VPEQDIDDLMRLATLVELPQNDRISDLDNIVYSLEVDEVIHCAGCVDYFDKRGLHLANIELTSKLLDAARRWDIQRILYLSSAYCAGYRSETILECLHPDPAPADEPTEYTRSKRIAEWRIADSSIPFVIIRPSIVVGQELWPIPDVASDRRLTMPRVFAHLVHRRAACPTELRTPRCIPDWLYGHLP
jgi:nucleoside-diphosphate-sugar epimerase